MLSSSEIQSAALSQFNNLNKSLSTKDKLRFGNKGSLVVDLTGKYAGRWHSFEDGQGGWVDGLDIHNNNRPERDLSRRSSPMSYQPDPYKSLRVDQILERCTAPLRSPVETYLERRGIYCSLPHSIKFCESPLGMAGIFQDANGDVVAVQITFLTRGGEKQERKVQKKTFSTGPNWHRHSAIKIPGKGELILCEGIETALSIHQVTGRPVWACTSTANISSIQVKNKRVTLAQDGDREGSPADNVYQRAAARFMKDGKKVKLIKPPEGKDLNDILLESGEGAVIDLVSSAKLFVPAKAKDDSFDGAGRSWPQS